MVITPNAQAARRDVVAKASRSVVVVHSRDGLGSAFAFGGAGELITNSHVVGGDRKVLLTDNRGRSQWATVMRVDPKLDVALLHAAAAPPPLPRATSAAAPGDTVLTIGAPGGLGGTVTQGIVSAVNRDVGGRRLIQIDLAVNPGNSGGPLLTEAGAVLGITAAKISSEEGVAFAIPVDSAVRGLAGQPTGATGPQAPDAKSGTSSSYLWLGAAAATAFGLALVLRHRLRRARCVRPVGRADVTYAVRRRAVDSSADEPLVVVRHRPSAISGEHAGESKTTSEETWT